MTVIPDLPPPGEQPVCEEHAVLAFVCGGPHRSVMTDLGREVLAPEEEPQGVPKEE